jgi:hypothetical protein
VNRLKARRHFYQERSQPLSRASDSEKQLRRSASKAISLAQVPMILSRSSSDRCGIGRIDKTIHMLNFIDDETRRRSTLQQLSLGEGRHSLGRVVVHAKRGELYQRYREGQEDQLSALSLVVNMIVLWNTLYIDTALDQLRAEGYSCSWRTKQGFRPSSTRSSICSDATHLPCRSRRPRRTTPLRNASEW